MADVTSDLSTTRSDAGLDTEAGPSMTVARAEALRLHKALFERQQALIGEAAHGYTGAFRRYERTFRERVRTYERGATFDEIAAAVRESHVACIGDYHTLRQAQRAFVKLVQQVCRRRRKVSLALEFVEAKHQGAVDAYVAGRVSERTFLKRIGYPRAGLAVWPNIKPIFDEARERGLRIIALEKAKGGTLAERDAFWAKRIVAELADNPGTLVLCLVGQLHCAPEHLPAAIRRAAGRAGDSLTQTVVYQNAEDIYWELERHGIALETQGVRVGDGEWCLINTCPVVAQQTFLDALESDDLLDTTQAEATFRDTARLVDAFLGLGVGEAIDDVEVFTADDLSFLSELRAGGQFSPEELRTMRRQILARESCYVPRGNFAYLAGLSINHAAEEACHFLRHAVSGEDVPRDRQAVETFYRRTMEEALAFFGSRLVNPRRKCPQLLDFSALARKGTTFERQVARRVVAHKAAEKTFDFDTLARLVQGDPHVLNAVTHALGYLLGEQLHVALMKDVVDRDEAREWFRRKLAGDTAAMRTYFELVDRVGRVRVPRHP